MGLKGSIARGPGTTLLGWDPGVIIAPMKPFLDSEYYSGSLDEERQVIVLKRSPKPFKDPEAMLKSLDEVLKEARGHGAEGWPLVADQVDAPQPTSERYRHMFAEMGKQMSERFSCIAVILESAESVEKVRQEASVRPNVQFFASQEDALAGIESMRGQE